MFSLKSGLLLSKSSKSSFKAHVKAIKNLGQNLFEFAEATVLLEHFRKLQFLVRLSTTTTLLQTVRVYIDTLILITLTR